MKSMKKILSLVLVLVLALGCLGMTASATNLYLPVAGVQFTKTGTTTTYNAVYNPSSTTGTFNVKIPNAVPTNTYTVTMTINDGNRFVSATLDGYTPTVSGSTLTWTNITLSSTSYFQISWYTISPRTLKTENFGIVVDTSAGYAELVSLTIGGEAATISTVYAGGIPRYSASLVYDYGTSLSNLAFSATAVNNVTSSYKLDGVLISGDNPVVTLTGSAQTLTVIDGNDSRDYRLVACVTDIDGYITVNVAVRTWAAYDFNNGDDTYYDYTSIGGGDCDPDIDALAEEIDYVGAATGTIEYPTWTLNTAQTAYRPVFVSYESVSVLPGSSAMDALEAYLDQVNDDNGTSLASVGSATYLSGISNGTDTLSEMSCGYMSGWMYLTRYTISDVDMDLPNLSAAAYTVTSGEYIDWIYTCAMGDDFGYGIMW